MRNKIVQKLISILLSFVLMTSILISVVRFVPTSELPRSKPLLVEGSNIIAAWLAWYEWVKGGGTWWGGGDTRNRPVDPN